MLANLIEFKKLQDPDISKQEIEKIKKDWRDLRRDKEIRNIKFENGCFNFSVSKFKYQNPETKNYISIPRINITVPLDKSINYTRGTSKKTIYREYIHPNIDGDGYVCLGNLRDIIYKLTDKEDYYAICSYIAYLIKNPGFANPYVNIRKLDPAYNRCRDCDRYFLDKDKKHNYCKVCRKYH